MSSDNEHEEEQQYEHDYGTINRTSLSANMSLRRMAGIREAVSLKDQFKIKVQAIAEEVSDVRGCLSRRDIASIIEPINDLSHIQYKNAKGFVLGFIGSSGGRSITKESIEKAIDCRERLIHPESIHEDIVTDEDIIKYSFYWRDTVKKN